MRITAMLYSILEKKPLHKKAVLTIILVSYLMIVLDIAVAITALPKIHSGLGFSDTGLAWVQNAYTLSFGGLLLLGARSSDILGRRRIFILGVALFTVASFIVGIAPTAFWLIAGRALQGAGAAILAPSTLALLSAYFPDGPERTRAIAYYGAVAGIGASAGLILGGILTSWLSWRVAFFINVPIGIALILVTISYVAETQRTQGQFDVVGALSSTLGMTAIVYGIIHSATAGFDDTFTIGMVVTGVLLLGFFVVNEWKAKQPIMPLRLFSSRERSGAYGARFLFLGAMMGFWFYITIFLQNVYGYTPLEAGLAFLPMTIANFIVAVAVPRLTERYGNGRLLVVGLVITMIGMAWLSRLSVEASYMTVIALPMVVIGAGQGATLGPLTASGIAGVTKEEAGAASGVVNVAHQLGGSLGLSVLVAVFAMAGSPGLDTHHILAERISAALTAGTVMLIVAFIVVVTLVVRSRPEGQIG